MSATLLLVEDNPTDEKLTMRAFKARAAGASVVVARDGKEARPEIDAHPIVDLLRASIQRPDQPPQQRAQSCLIMNHI